MWVFLVFMKLMNAIPDLFGFSVNSDGVYEVCMCVYVCVCARAHVHVSFIHQKCLSASVPIQTIQTERKEPNSWV